MQATKASEQATVLYRAHGPAAEAKVAELVRSCEARGNSEEAEDWKRIQRSIRSLRGPHES